MPFKLSAMAPSFCMPPQSSASTTESPLSIICRENDEIGVYEGGVLKPRKGVTSLIAWKEKTPFTRALASATDARHAVITPTPSATPEKDATLQTASPLLGPSANEELQTMIAGGNTLGFHPEPTLFHYQTYALPLPCDIAVAEANRPGWNPAYHKTISPSIERANQVVEEFKVYFGDGRSPELLLVNLQKICILCGLCEASNLPKTSEDCITVRSRLPTLAPVLPLTNPRLSIDAEDNLHQCLRPSRSRARRPARQRSENPRRDVQIVKGVLRIQQATGEDLSAMDWQSQPAVPRCHDSIPWLKVERNPSGSWFGSLMVDFFRFGLEALSGLRYALGFHGILKSHQRWS